MYPRAPSTADIQTAILHTHACQDWTDVDYRLHPERALARDGLLNMMLMEPVSAFEAVADHGFWRHWRSKKSSFKTDALHFAIKSAHDLNWIRVLADHLQPSPDSDYTAHVQNRFGLAVEKVVDILKEKNLYRESDDFFRGLALAGQFTPIKSLMDQGEYARPITGVEKVLVARHNFEKNKQLTHGVVLDYIWDKWGTEHVNFPDLWDQAWQRHAFAEEKQPWRDATRFLLRFHHPKSSTWTPHCEYVVAHRYVTGGCLDTFKRMVLDEGWPLSPPVWDKLLEDVHRFGRYRHVLPNAPELESFYTKMLLEKSLAEQQAPSLSVAPSRKKL